MSVRPFLALLIAASVATTPVPVLAQQFSDGYNFIKAVKDADGDKVMSLIQKSGGGNIVNSRDPANGQTALDIVAARSDPTYLRFLLGKGADPNLKDRDGDTPAMIAVQNHFEQGLEILAAHGADLNIANNRGETPLIRAVQMHAFDMVTTLLADGADPDQRDVIAGLSARDYAKRDGRSPAIDKALAAAPKKKAATGMMGPGY